MSNGYVSTHIWPLLLVCYSFYLLIFSMQRFWKFSNSFNGYFPLLLLSRSPGRWFMCIAPTFCSGFILYYLPVQNSCRSFPWGDINCQALSFTHCLVHSRWLGTVPSGTSCWYVTNLACLMFPDSIRVSGSNHDMSCPFSILTLWLCELCLCKQTQRSSFWSNNGKTSFLLDTCWKRLL